ncbi:MAG: hypothetical protein OHK0012_10680 [Synechococcales cyanobacterium]
MQQRLSPVAQRLLAFEQKLDWVCLSLLWLIIGIPSLWLEREALRRMVEYFTWTSLRLLLFSYRSWTGVGLLVCLSATLVVLLGHSRYELFGLWPWERRRLERKAKKICLQGSRHPLWQILRLHEMVLWSEAERRD